LTGLSDPIRNPHEHASPFAYIQPDLQWVLNPGGKGNILNALVLGAQMGVTF
jgi:porin